MAPYVYAPILIVAGGWLAHRLACRVPPRLLAVCLLIVSGWMLAGVLLTALPGKMPIGYANANAALAVQLMALAGLVGLDVRARRFAWFALVIAMLTVLANRSAAGAAVALPVLVASGVATVAAPGRRRWPIAVLSVSTLAMTTSGLVALARRAAWPPAALEAFDEVRRILWLQAWGAFREAETAGRGPGSFDSLNVLTDPDQSSVHSLPLQVAVELGGVGVALLVALYLCGLAVALRAATPSQSWIAATAWTALAVHAFVDHLVEYWPIVLAAGLVLGYGLVSQSPSKLEDTPVEVAGTGPSRS